MLRFNSRGFTLVEVMVAIAILGIAMLGLLGLHHQSLQSVIRAQDTTRAAMLAQAVMTQPLAVVAVGGNALITLSDGTTITVTGVSHIPSSHISLT